MKALVLILGLLALVAAQEVEYVTVSDNKESNRPSGFGVEAQLVDLPEDKSVSESKYYSSGTATASEENEQSIAEQEQQEVSFLQTSAGGPRKFVQFPKQGNTGTPIATYKKLSPRRCMELCNANAMCAGFTVKRNGRGDCVLRSTWGGSVVAKSHDAYQVIDYAVKPVDPLSLKVQIGQTGQQLLILGNLQSARLPRGKTFSEFELNVDERHAFSSIANLNWQHKHAQALLSTTWHAVSLPLNKGQHLISLTRKVGDHEGPKFDDCTPRHLVAFPFPRNEGNKLWDIAGEVWNLGETSSSSSRAFTPLPGTPMKIQVPAVAGSRILVLGEISRVQHSNKDVNSVYRIVVDGKELAYTNVGDSYSWNYKQVTLRGLTAPLTNSDIHTISVQGKTNSGTVHYINDGNGHQQRRLTAVVVPGDMAWEKTWNPGQSQAASKTWVDLPGVPMKLEKIEVKTPTWVLIFASISRVQTWGAENVEFRVVLNDNLVMAQHKTSIVQGWQYSDVNMEGYYFLQPGTHTFSVEFKTKTGATVLFADDYNGFQQRRLMVVGMGVPSGMDSMYKQTGKFCEKSETQ